MIEMKLFLDKDIEFSVKDHARGKQADVIVLEEFDGVAPCVLKVIGKDKNFTHAEASMLHYEAMQYYDELKQAGIELPRKVKSGVIERVGEEGSLIYLIDEFVGDGIDLKKQIDTSMKPEEYVAMVVGFVAHLPLREGTRTTVMGDFKFENFVYDAGRGKLVFVDYFGPKRVGENGLVTPYSAKVDPDLTAESITFLCGDKKGIAGRICALAKRNWPHLYDLTRDLMIDNLNENDQKEVAQFILDEDKNGYATIQKVYRNEPVFFDTV